MSGKDLIEALEDLEGTPGLARAWLLFRIQLATAWKKAVSEMRSLHESLEDCTVEQSQNNSPGGGDSVSTAEVGCNRATEQTASGLLAPNEVQVDSRIARQLLKEVGDAVALYGTGSAEWKRIVDAADDSANELYGVGLAEQLIRMVLPEAPEDQAKQIASRLGIEQEGLWLAGNMLAGPFVQEAVRKFRKGIVEEEDDAGTCPHCGSIPELAILDKESGRRYLVCTLCETRWAFPRMKCPACGETDQRGLSFVAPDEITGRRLEVCLSCRFPLRTIDCRSSQTEFVPFLEDTATLPLLFLPFRR